MLKLLSLFALFTTSFASIKNCDTSSLFKITELTLIPDPPVPGQLLQLHLLFDNPDREITEGTVTTTVSLNYIPITPTVESLCKNTECPITIGINNRSTETTFPDVNGLLKSKVVWTDVNDDVLLCIETSLKITE
jgi:hypothetical protein